MNLSTYEHKDYSLGLNDTASPIDIDEGEASLLRNWDITYQGQLRRRDGLLLVGAAIDENPVTGMVAYMRDGGSDLLVSGSTNLWYLNGASFSKLANNLTADPMIDFANVQSLNKIFFSSENNVLQYWDRASTTLNTCIITPANGGNPIPNGNKLLWWENFMFILNNATLSGTVYPHRCFFCNLGDPTTWTAATDFFDVPGDGRLITAIDAGTTSTGPQFIFFKERSIQILTGYGTASFKISSTASDYSPVDGGIGCIAPRGVVRVDNDIWFIDTQAQIRSLQRTIYGTFEQSIMSTKIRGTLGRINQTQLSKTVAWYHANKVYFNFPNNSDTHNTITCVFDLIAAKRTQQEAWTTYTGWTPSVMCGSITNGIPDLYIGDATTGKVYKHGGMDDNGVAIDARYDGKDSGFGALDRFKRYAYGYITGPSGSGNINVGVYGQVDQKGFAQLNPLNLIGNGSKLGPTGSFHLGPTGKAAIGGSSKNEDKYNFTQGGGTSSGKTLQMSIRHNVAGQQPTVNTYTVNFKLRQLR